MIANNGRVQTAFIRQCAEQKADVQTGAHTLTNRDLMRYSNCSENKKQTKPEKQKQENSIYLSISVWLESDTLPGS